MHAEISMELGGPCSECDALCCRKYSVCLNGRDIMRIFNNTNNFEWIDITEAKNVDPEIAHSFSVYNDGKIEDYILILRMTDDENCTFLKKNNHCKIYELRPMICRIYPFNQKISGRLEYKENFRCPMRWELNEKDSEKLIKDIEKNKQEVSEYKKWCDEWNASVVPGKTISDFLEFILAKAGSR